MAERLITIADKYTKGAIKMNEKIFLLLSRLNRIELTKRFVFIVGGTALALTLIVNTTSLLISPSKSLEQQVFLLLKGTTVSKGQFAAIKGHPTAYFGDVIYTKQVLGIAGDRIEHQNGVLTINGKLLALLPHTSKGQPLTPLKAQAIPKGYVFAAGDHPRSFDSRYEEFGLVEECHVLGRVWGLF